MAASPWSHISLAVCLLVSVSVSSGNVLPQDGAVFHTRVVRQLPFDFEKGAETARQSFHDVASAGAQQAQDLAEKARSHLSQRVRRSADYRYGPAGERMGPRFQSRFGDPFTDGRYRRDSIDVAEEVRREREERWRERRERERERHEREREREEREREREHDERERERDEMRRERERDRYRY